MSEDGADSRATMRLQKFLAGCGVASRRNSEKLMTEGRVAVNGSIIRELGTKVCPGRDVVTVDGRQVGYHEDGMVYLMLNKPGGYITTMSDEQGRPCVASLVPADRYAGLFHVGRLDCDTTGLLLFTNDGELCRALLSPASHVEKRYRAQVDGHLTETEADILRRGVTLQDGPCLPARISIDQAGGTSRVTCIIHEGRKRQVKRMFKAIGHPVLMLDRDAFGPLELGDLELGLWRLLTDNEIQSLRDAVRRDDDDTERRDNDDTAVRDRDDTAVRDGKGDGTWR